MEIKGFDHSFLTNNVGEDDLWPDMEAFLDKITIPSNYLDITTGIAAAVSKDRGGDDVLTPFCDAVRLCKVKEDYLKYLDNHVHDKEQDIYKEIVKVINEDGVDPTITFPTLTVKLLEYQFIDEKVFTLFIWMVSTGNMDCLKDFCRFCLDNSLYLSAVSILMTLFQECKVIVPSLYYIDPDDCFGALINIYPEFYEYLFEMDDVCDTITVKDLVNYIDERRGADKLYDSIYLKLIDLVYDTLENVEYSESCFIDAINRLLIPSLVRKWTNDEHLKLAQNVLYDFITLKTGGLNGH